LIQSRPLALARGGFLDQGQQLLAHQVRSLVDDEAAGLTVTSV